MSETLNRVVFGIGAWLIVVWSILTICQGFGLNLTRWRKRHPKSEKEVEDEGVYDGMGYVEHEHKWRR